MIRGIRHRYDISTEPSLGLLRRRVVAWLGLILLAVNLLAGSGLAAHASKPTSASLTQELLGDHIVVCTSAGMMVLDSDGHPVDVGGGYGHSDPCVFCLPLLHAVSTASVVSSIEPLEHAPFRRMIPEDAPVWRGAFTSGAASPRGPPLS